jgi:integrase/recombinase XerC
VAGLTDPFLSPALGASLAQWLSQLSALEGAAANTIEAYRRDVARYLRFLSTHRGGAEGIAAVARTTQSDLRAWMAEERARGLSARSLARALSAVKGFTAWAADRTGADATTVLSARGPKFRRKLPRPLSEDSASEILT